MKTIEVSKAHHLSKLHDELIAANTRVKPFQNSEGKMETDCHVQSDGKKVIVFVPDDSTAAEEQAIKDVITAHDPTPPPPPPDPRGNLAATLRRPDLTPVHKLAALADYLEAS